jgi:hypothetical protein
LPIPSAINVSIEWVVPSILYNKSVILIERGELKDLLQPFLSSVLNRIGIIQPPPQFLPPQLAAVLPFFRAEGCWPGPESALPYNHEHENLHPHPLGIDIVLRPGSMRSCRAGS